MPRRIFTARDLAPLRKVAEQILQKQPDAALVAAAAAPFKRRIARPGHEERTEARLPVEVETSARPEGVPLHEIAKEVRKEFPGVTGLSVTPGGLSLKFDREPTPAQRKKINELLSDRGRLERLKPGIRGVARPLAAQPPAADDLRQVLHDPETTDAAWLRAFRSYAMEHLVDPPVPAPVPVPAPAPAPSGGPSGEAPVLPALPALPPAPAGGADAEAPAPPSGRRPGRPPKG